MKALLRSVLDTVFSAKPGYRNQLTNYLMGEKLSTALRLFESKGVPLRVVYDVGARHGDWAKAMRKVLPRSEFVLFEANESCAPVLKQSGFRHFIGVLSSEAKLVDFYASDSTGDSYYKENTPRYDSIAPSPRQTNTLDSLVETHGLPPVDLLKLDTQGSELDILRGGLAALKACSLAYLECPILNYNSGAPTLQAYLDFLGEHGLVPYDFCELHYAYGALVQVDVLFVRKELLQKLQPQSAGIPKFLT